MKIHEDTYDGFWRVLYYATYLIQVVIAFMPSLLNIVILNTWDLSEGPAKIMCILATLLSLITVFGPLFWFDDVRKDITREYL